MSRNSKKQSILCIIKNNFWILKLIKIYAPSLIVDQVIRVPVSVLGTFVSINFTRWIIDFVDQQYSFKRIVYLIIAIFSFFIITNLLYAISSIILIPQKQINLSAKIRENVIKKVSRINQIEFQKSDFFNIYTLGLNEIDSRPYKVLTTLFSAITSVISIFVVTGVTVGISAGFSILGIIAAVTDAGFGVIRQKYNYKQTIETTPDGRKRGYINRITYQPEFAEDLKVYPEFLNLLLERYRKATQSVKKIILKNITSSPEKYFLDTINLYSRNPIYPPSNIRFPSYSTPPDSGGRSGCVRPMCGQNCDGQRNLLSHTCKDSCASCNSIPRRCSGQKEYEAGRAEALYVYRYYKENRPPGVRTKYAAR